METFFKFLIKLYVYEMSFKFKGFIYSKHKYTKS